MWGLRGKARKCPIGTVSVCLKIKDFLLVKVNITFREEVSLSRVIRFFRLSIFKYSSEKASFHRKNTRKNKCQLDIPYVVNW